MNSQTWLDLNSDGIISPLGARSAPDIGKRAVMVSVEPDFRKLSSSIKPCRTLPFFMGSLILPESAETGAAVAGPYVGAPYGVMLLESLIAKGADSVIIMGWCGAVNPDLKIGDVFVPDSALCDEGCSRNYMASEEIFPEARPSSHLSKRLEKAADQSGHPWAKGKVWTTDAIYRETPRKVSFFRNLGADVVEMECSALFAVAAFRKIDIAALLVVSDEVNSGPWKPGFRNPAFREGRKRAIRIIQDLCGIPSEESKTPEKRAGKIPR